jgi:uncharacterized membrane protein
MIFSMALAFALHVLFAVIWVGGMFFAYMFLRPAAGPLAGAERAALWGRVLQRFFNWVLVAVPVMLASGIAMTELQGGFMNIIKEDPHVATMFAIGVLMMLLFLHVYFAPFRRLKKAVAAGDTEAALRQIATIRKLVALNLALGVAVVLVATAGKYLLT